MGMGPGSDEAATHAVPVVDVVANVRMRDVIGNKEDARSEVVDTASLVAMVRELLQEAYQIERHLHSGERWFGIAGEQVGETVIAERIGAGDTTAEAGPLVVDAGNDDWGTWTQILGSADTPCDGGDATHFDLNRIRFVTAEVPGARHMIQIALQEDAPDDDPGTNDTYTEFDVYFSAPVSHPLAYQIPIEMQAERVPTQTKVWMRTWVDGQDTGTLSFYFGIHEYAR